MELICANMILPPFVERLVFCFRILLNMICVLMKTLELVKSQKYNNTWIKHAMAMLFRIQSVPLQTNHLHLQFCREFPAVSVKCSAADLMVGWIFQAGNGRRLRLAVHT